MSASVRVVLVLTLMASAVLAAACSDGGRGGASNATNPTIELGQTTRPLNAAAGTSIAGARGDTTIELVTIPTIPTLATTLPAADGSAVFEAAVSAYVLVFATGDTNGGWAMVSNRCQQSVPERQFKAAVASSGQLYPEMRAANVSVEVDGDQGRASYETGADAVGPYVQQPWRFEDGAWNWDDC